MEVFHVDEGSLTTLAALALVASQLTTLVRFVQAGETGRAVTTVVPWVTAFAALLLGSMAEATSALVLPGFADNLGNMDAASLAFAAMVVGSAGGAFHKVTVAVDSSQSAAEPRLGPAPDASSNIRGG